MVFADTPYKIFLIKANFLMKYLDNPKKSIIFVLKVWETYKVKDKFLKLQ